MNVLLLVCCCLALLDRTVSSLQGQQLIDYIARRINIQYAVVDNLKYPTKLTGKLSITNTGHLPLRAGPWSLYVCHIRLLEPDAIKPDGTDIGESGLRVYHVNGCLHRLVPNQYFRKLAPKQSLNVHFNASDWMVARTDVMPNWYVTAPKGSPAAIHSTMTESLDFVEAFDKPEQFRRSVDDKFRPYKPEERFALQKDVVSGDKVIPASIVPTPVEMQLDDTQLVFVDKGWVVIAEQPVIKEANFLAASLGLVVLETNNAPDRSSLFIVITLADVIVGGKVNTDDEAYRLDIDARRQIIKVSANNPAGAFYSVQSLLSLLSEGRGVPHGHVSDYPRFKYRGMHLDVARNFRPKKDVLKLLDAMSRYKLNKFHFHLTDDEGWRLQIPHLPELTKVGGRRCHDEAEDLCLIPQLGSGPAAKSPGSGFYTTSDYKKILRYAAQRHIEVIPSFDMPGHARAAIVAMKARYRKYIASNAIKARQYLLSDVNDKSEYLTVQYFDDDAINPCMESTYAFVDRLIRKVKCLHKGIQPLTTFYFGGDEVATGAWVKSEACANIEGGTLSQSELKQRFVQRVAAIANKHGLTLSGWEDALLGEGGVPINKTLLKAPEVHAYSWQNIWEWGGANRAYRLANQDYKVVLSHATHLYFDHPQEPDPEERGYYWASRFTNTRKVFGYLPDSVYDNIDTTRMGDPLHKETFCATPNACTSLEDTHRANVIGMQGHLWSETVRTTCQMHEMIFPRMLALAERAWHMDGWEKVEDATQREKHKQKSWIKFAKVLGFKELKRLDKIGISYHLLPPGAKVINSIMTTNVEYPGLTAECSFNNMYSWSKCAKAVCLPPGSAVHLRTRSTNGKRVSRAIVVHGKKVSPSCATDGECKLLRNVVNGALRRCCRRLCHRRCRSSSISSVRRFLTRRGAFQCQLCGRQFPLKRKRDRRRGERAVRDAEKY